MALADNRTQLQDCDATADVSGDSDASPNSRTTEAGLVIEGPSAIQFQVTDAQEHILFDQDSAGSTFSLNLIDQTVYIAIKDNLADTFANLGGLICLADGAPGDDIGYAVAGVDVGGLPYEKKYAFYKLDVSVIDAAPGTDNVDFFTYSGVEANCDHTAILQIGYGSIHLAKGQGTIPNAWFDGIYYIANDSFAATVSGGTSGTPETMPLLVADDVTVGAGMFSNPIGDAFYLFAPTEFGDAGTASSGFEGIDEQWYYLGDNGGGHSVGATHFPFRLVGNATGTNAFRQTRVSIINVGTRAQFDFSDADFDEFELDTTTWVDFGALTFPVQDVAKFCNDGTFINCDQMDLQSCDMDGNTWIGSSNADGVIVWDATVADVENQISSTFIRSGTHNAIEIAPVGAGPFTFDVTGLIVDGFASQDDVDAVETEKVFYINPATLSADININLSSSSAINIGGGADTGTDGFSYRIVGSYTGTVTITRTVTLTVTVVDENNVAIPYASVSIQDQADDSEVSAGVANNLGVYTDSTFNYTSDLAVNTVARKSSPGDIRYGAVSSPALIENTGLVQTVGLAADTNAGLLPMVGVLRHGIQSEDVNDASITATINVPAGGTNRVLVVAGMYWAASSNLGITPAIKYDGGNMSPGQLSFLNSTVWYKLQIYRLAIPDGDEGPKTIEVPWSGSVSIKGLAFVLLDDVTATPESSASQTGDAVTTNPSLALNNTTADSYSVGFIFTDDLDSPSATGATENRVRRSDLVRDGLLQSVTILVADRASAGAHNIGADFGSNSKTWVSAGHTYAKY